MRQVYNNHMSPPPPAAAIAPSLSSPIRRCDRSRRCRFIITFLAAVAFRPPSSLPPLWSRSPLSSRCRDCRLAVVVASWSSSRSPSQSSSYLSLSPRGGRRVVIIAVAATVVTMVSRWQWLGTKGSVGRYVGDRVDAVACREWCGSWPREQG